jgi:hypothetical protein
MLSRFEALPLKIRIIVAITIGMSIFLIPVLLVTFSLRYTNALITPIPPIKFEYCEADPDALCILSFGRDGSGDAIINFFVPDKKFPNFYLLIKKAVTESRYECIQNNQIKTSVFCSGDALSLKQTIQIDIHANDDDRLLATDTFLLEAFLVSTPFASGTGTDTALQEPSATMEDTETSTSEASETMESLTPEVSETSYPNSTTYP